MISKVMLGLAVFSILPVWRDPTWSGGVNTWRAVYELATKPQKEHIPVDEAIYLAHKAWSESQGVV